MLGSRRLVDASMIRHVFFLFFLLAGSAGAIVGVQRSDCVRNCSHIESDQEFGVCLSECSKLPRLDNVADVEMFALPPSKAWAATEVVMDSGKILETSVQWTAPEDSLRTGFYLRYSAVEQRCQRHFPGYFTSSLPADSRSHKIPLEFHGHPLIVDHGCSYRLQMHSIPYPAGDARFLVEAQHKVPECIGKYCECKDDAVPNAENPKAEEVRDGVLLTWKFQQTPARQYTFYADLYERFTAPIKLLSDRPFNFQIVNDEPFEFRAEPGEDFFERLLPHELKRNEQYKVSLFAVDDLFCHNTDVFAFFNTSDDVPTRQVNTTATIPTTSLPKENVFGAEVLAATEGIGKASSISPHRLLMESTFFLVILLGVACLSPVCTISILLIIRRRRKNLKRRSSKFGGWTLSHSRHSIMETNILYRQPLDIVSQSLEATDWRIRSCDIAVGSVIGEGAFGLVCKGTLRANGLLVRVAVKQLKANAVDEEREEFNGEIRMMQVVGRHENIVAMYGYCLDEEMQCMVMEYVPYGDLKHYLQNVRKQHSTFPLLLQQSECDMTSSVSEKMQYTLDPQELHSFAIQVANGMAHLEALGITHRDLAARNILVGEGKKLKISDFGMSRPGVYVKMSRGVIPLRWLSPEAISENTYSTKSDVWAYGVVLWEILTLGGFPYVSIADKDLHQHLLEGKRLEKPPHCSIQIYELMSQSWKLDPRERPSFITIAQMLNGLQCPYVDFTPPSSLPPQEITPKTP
ncbi:unnamed protein product [Caenorhabditis auriculariae]|uniref:Protein kinase domain-containing protein n=1 Tax=Caenorhabditis auriculariae TaxID=2777116 RepID=A0A8S1GYQ3_9PELO|nr:unnamed protein product [Caenorhabditis auriculariae]